MPGATFCNPAERGTPGTPFKNSHDFQPLSAAAPGETGADFKSVQRILACPRSGVFRFGKKHVCGPGKLRVECSKEDKGVWIVCEPYQPRGVPRSRR